MSDIEIDRITSEGPINNEEQHDILSEEGDDNIEDMYDNDRVLPTNSNEIDHKTSSRSQHPEDDVYGHVVQTSEFNSPSSDTLYM